LGRGEAAKTMATAVVLICAVTASTYSAARAVFTLEAASRVRAAAAKFSTKSTRQTFGMLRSLSLM
jgi:hypothetical protein